MKTANAERQAAHKQRRLDAGEWKVPVWVPKSKVAEIKAIARKMCEEQKNG